ncbi:MAG: hypothetical protein U0520_01255 [Candidatus Saccharimonadales bacterium]
MATLVTGTPGSGKTTLVGHAQSIGNEQFFDTDEISGLCEWREFETGKVLGLVTEYKETGQDDWYAEYGWYWREDVLKEFLAKHPNAILCGSSENITDFYGLFDKIVIMKKTDEELLSNLASPDRNNPFGKTPEQRKNFMNWQDHLIKEAQGFNPIILDGNQIDVTYKKILDLG